MPTTSVLILRASLVALLLGGLAGILAALHSFPVAAWFHSDVMLLGFMLPFAFGTAAWILPKKGGVRSVQLPAAVYGTGFIALMASYFIQIPAVEAMGRLTILAGGVLFLAALWPRVRHIQALRHTHSTEATR